MGPSWTGTQTKEFTSAPVVWMTAPKKDNKCNAHLLELNEKGCLQTTPEVQKKQKGNHVIHWISLKHFIRKLRFMLIFCLKVFLVWLQLLFQSLKEQVCIYSSHKIEFLVPKENPGEKHCIFLYVQPFPVSLIWQSPMLQLTDGPSAHSPDLDHRTIKTGKDL